MTIQSREKKEEGKGIVEIEDMLLLSLFSHERDILNFSKINARFPFEKRT
jgi:hypothetical protein